MALESVRSGQPFRLSNLIPFSRSSVPLFAGHKPTGSVPFQSPRSIQAGNRLLDIFQPAAPRTARIILRPEGSLQHDLSTNLAMHVLLDQSTPTVPAAENTAKALLSMLSNALSGKLTLDKLGNMVAPFRAVSVNRKKLSTAQDTERAQLLESTGRRNLRSIVNAFQAKLNTLPANIKEVTVDLPRKLPDGVNRADLVRELAELVALNGYNYNQLRSQARPANRLETVIFNKSGLDNQDADQAIREGQALGEAMNLTRHFVDSPANLKTTRYISDKAKSLASPTLDVKVRERDFIEGRHPENRKAMGMFLSVGQGNDKTNADRDPRLVEMIYTPSDWDPATGKTILLVGKGIIFDTGGNNLKTSEYIHNMQGDMAGAAAVIGALKTIDQVQLKGVRVIGLAPLTENRMGSSASLPGDVVGRGNLPPARNGKTVEINNTDAEGRLVLGDAIHYGMETYKPDLVADIATLTGGKVSGVGEQNSVALSGNNPELIKQVNKLESEHLGRVSMPLFLTPAHHNWVTHGERGKADISNSVSMADARLFGVIKNPLDRRESMLQHSAQGAAFLREFLPKGREKTPWVHYDMAGAEYDKADPKRGNETWATGFGVKDLYHLVKQVAEGQLKPDASKSELAKPKR